MGKLITDGKTDEWYRGTAQLGHGVLWSSLTSIHARSTPFKDSRSSPRHNRRKTIVNVYKVLPMHQALY
jgi:hypothetical protein